MLLNNQGCGQEKKNYDQGNVDYEKIYNWCIVHENIMTDALRMVIFSSYRYFAVFLIFHFKRETTGMKKRLRPVTRFLILHTALTIDVIDGQAFFLTSTFNNVDTFSVKSFQLSIESCLVSQYRSFPVFRNCSSHECFKISKVKLQFKIKIDSLKTMKFSKNS